jgi:hypothetical protein
MPFQVWLPYVIPSDSAANPIVLDHIPQELATSMVALSYDKARRASSYKGGGN